MPAFYDYSTVSQVQQANDIVDVITEHVSLAKKGREMLGLCPFHDDHRPSLYVNTAKQIFKCFACGAGGDVLKFVQMRENLTFPQAVERLADRVGIKVKPSESQKKRPNEPGADVDPNRLARVNAWASQYFQQNLYDRKKGIEAQKYIVEREITLDTARKWQFGLAVGTQDDLIGAAKAKNIPMELLAHAGLIVRQGRVGAFRDKFVNRLMFPITDVTGRVLGFGGRTLQNDDAKYLNSPATVLFDKSNCLYGLQQARHHIVSSQLAVVVEGYTDCIMAHQFGCPNVVATLGTSLTTGHARILRRFAKKIVLIFDSDTAGIEAANRALQICLSQHIDIKIASVPKGKDPCDFLLSAGKEPFEKLVADAVDIFRFKWDRLTDRFSGDETFAGKKAAIEEFLETIATAVQAGSLPAIDRGLIINRLSRIIGLDSKEINAELTKRLTRLARSANRLDTVRLENQKVQSADLGDGFFAAAQREVLEVLLNEPKLFEIVKQRTSVEDFDVPILRQIAAVLFDNLATGKENSLTAVLAAAESLQAGSLIVELAQAGEKKANFRSRLTGALDAIDRYRIQNRKSRIEATEDQRKFLRDVVDNTAKQNPHSMGMT